MCEGWRILDLSGPVYWCWSALTGTSFFLISYWDFLSCSQLCLQDRRLPTPSRLGAGEVCMSEGCSRHLLVTVVFPPFTADCEERSSSP